MRILLILRGNYHAGQYEFILQNELKDYTLDINELRFLSARSKNTLGGLKSLNYKNDNELNRILLYFLKIRMQKGEFCVINAYNEALKSFKDLATLYRYKLFIIDFSDTSLHICKQRNALEAQKTGFLIPTKLLEKTHSLLKKIPKKYAVLKPNEWKNCLYQMPNLSAYKKIHHIGDLQGCYSVLKKYLRELKDDEYYIFLGDYIDRGIENGKVLKFLLKICEKENVCLLEGNHERYLIKWANGELVNYKEFSENTLKDFRKEKLTPKDARNFYPHLKECLWYKYGSKKIFCSHGGITLLPKKSENLSFVPSNDFIYGVGDYDDSLKVAEEFLQNHPFSFYQIFGHRNRLKLPVKLNKRVFLCEGKVDDGGFLRIVTLDKKGFECVEVKNEIYRKK